jgi:hypothetical protein
MKHYFAYGTLLDVASMQAFAPSAVPVGIMRLDGWRLGFAMCADGSKGGCTLEPAPDAVLYGMQYALSDGDMEKMDKASGIDRGLWAHKPVTVVDAKGQRVDTVTYVIPGKTAPFAPPDAYVRPILKGLAELPLDKAYADAVRGIIQRAQGSADRR